MHNFKIITCHLKIVKFICAPKFAHSYTDRVHLKDKKDKFLPNYNGYFVHQTESGNAFFVIPQRKYKVWK